MHAAASSLAFTDYTTRPKTLTLNGLTLLGGSGSPGYGVPVESIELTEQGPGQVSSLTFRIDDPNLAITLTDNALVRFWDNAHGDLPLFLGFVASWSATSLGIGRSITVECIGIEAMLDWLYVPVVITWPANPTAAQLVQTIQDAIGQSLGAGFPLNALASSAVGGAAGSGSSETVPIATEAWFLLSAGSAGPGTLRSVLTTILGAAYPAAAYQVFSVTSLQLTVDFYGGIRVWALNGNAQPSATQYVGILVSAPGGLVIRPEALEHRAIPGEAVRQVYVKGGTAAGSGIVSDGSGVPGPMAVLDAPSSLSADDVHTYGSSYLARNGGVVQGVVQGDDTLFLDVGTATNAQTRAGCQLQLTDLQAGANAVQAQVSSIGKTFYPSGAEHWMITYGLRRSGAQYLRQLTRTTLS